MKPLVRTLAPLGGPIHSKESINATRTLAGRRCVSRFELYKKGTGNRSFGQNGGAPQGVGNLSGSITQLAGANESSPGDNPSESTIEYEVVLYAKVDILPDYRLYEPAYFPAWKPGQAYARNQKISPAKWPNGRVPVMECVRSGASGASEPIWPTKRGFTVADGGALWRLADYATVYEVIASNSNETQRVETIVRVKEVEG